MRRIRVLLLGVALAACGGEPAVERPSEEATPAEGPHAARPRPPTPEEQVAARRTLARWLLCEECVDGELEALVQLGADVAEPTLIATLLEGPSPAARALREHELRSRYPELVAFARAHPHVSVGMNEDEYVATYLANVDALQRSRAAQGLATLRGPGAEDALRKAQGLGLRADVRQVVDESLAALAGPSR